MNFLVIGLGSMGKRRIRLILNNKLGDVAGVDFDEEKRMDTSNTYKIETYKNIQEAMEKEKIDAFVISTSPLAHAEIIKKIIEYELPVFTEINLNKEHFNEVDKMKSPFFVSSTMLYRKEIQQIAKEIDKKRVSYNYHVGQYLPDWHPWQSYKDFFVVNKKSNGCRELFAIELPWIINTFGKIKSLQVLKRKISTLEIDYPDSYSLLLEHEDGTIGTLQVDVVTRRTMRELHVFGEDVDIIWKGTPETLFKFDINKKEDEQILVYKEFQHQEGYAQNIIEDAYLEEIKNYIEMIKGRSAPLYPLKDELYVLDMIDQIEEVL